MAAVLEMMAGSEEWLKWWRTCGHSARRAEKSEAALIGDIANDESTLAKKRLG